MQVINMGHPDGRRISTKIVIHATFTDGTLVTEVVGVSERCVGIPGQGV